MKLTALAAACVVTLFLPTECRYDIPGAFGEAGASASVPLHIHAPVPPITHGDLPPPPLKPFVPPPHPETSPAQLTAVVTLSQTSSVKGSLTLFHLQQHGSLASDTVITGVLTGLQPNSRHGFHIHEYGDLSSGCTSAGSHFNPHGAVHGSEISPQRHEGDLGNVEADNQGTVFVNKTIRFLRLGGPMSAQVIGRSLILHEKEDDLGMGANDSLKTGNAGGRLACGVIGIGEPYGSQNSQAIPPSSGLGSVPTNHEAFAVVKPSPGVGLGYLKAVATLNNGPLEVSGSVTFSQHRHSDERVSVLTIIGGLVPNYQGFAKADKIVDFTDGYGLLNLLGRTIVIHEKEDDLGTGEGDSRATGNAGARLACGVIGIAEPPAFHLDP